MFAGGGASAAGSACAVQPTSASSEAKGSTKKKRSNPAADPNCRALLRFMSRMVVVSSPSWSGLELDHDGVPQAGLVLPQIGTETRASSYTCVARGRREERTRHERSVSHQRSAARVRNRAGE